MKSTTVSNTVLQDLSKTVLHCWSKVVVVKGFWTALQTDLGSSQHSWETMVLQGVGGMPARILPVKPRHRRTRI